MENPGRIIGHLNGRCEQVGDANSKLSKGQDEHSPTIREYIEFAAGLVFFGTMIVFASASLYLMVTNYTEYQSHAQLILERLTKSNPVLPLIPPNLSPLVKSANVLFFTLILSNYSAAPFWIIVWFLAGWGFAVLALRIWKSRRTPIVSIEE